MLPQSAKAKTEIWHCDSPTRLLKASTKLSNNNLNRNRTTLAGSARVPPAMAGTPSVVASGSPPSPPSRWASSPCSSSASSSSWPWPSGGGSATSRRRATSPRRPRSRGPPSAGRRQSWPRLVRNQIQVVQNYLYYTLTTLNVRNPYRRTILLHKNLPLT